MAYIPKRFTVLLVALLLVACSAPVINKEQTVGLKSIGVVSLLPDQISYQKIGVTVFNNEYVNKSVGDALNRKAQISAVAEIKKYSDKTAVVLEVDANTLAKSYRSGALAMAYDVERIRGDLISLAKQNKLDAIIVIAERFDSKNGIDGVRVYLSAGLKDIRAATIQTGMTVSIMAADGGILGVKSAGGQYGMNRAISRPNGAWSYKLDDNLDEATLQHISKNVQSAIAEDVATSLRLAGF